MSRVPIIDLDTLQKLIDMGKTYSQIAKELNCSNWRVMQDCRHYGIRSKAGHNYTEEQRKLMSEKKKLAWRNGSYDNRKPLDTNSKDKISQTIKERWAQGVYKDRINGMLGVSGWNHSEFDQSKHYRNKLIFYTPDGKLKCARCGADVDTRKIDVHHVDEDHNNILLSNLEPLCVKCHQKYHVIACKTPFTTVTSTFKFDAAHYLPFHDKKCKFLHGHSYKLEVTVRRRVDPDTGMVIDFGKLKTTVKTQVEEVFDHGYLNNFLPMPTSENIILWIWMQLSFDVKGLYKLRLYETETNYSELTQADVLEFVKSYDMEANWLEDDKLVEEYMLKQQAIKWLQIDRDDPSNPAIVSYVNNREV